MTADITEIPSFPLLWYLPSKQNNSSEIFRVFCALPLMINFYCWLCVCVSINVMFFFSFPPPQFLYTLHNICEKQENLFSERQAKR
jgi:hypothetical protein